MFGYLATLLFAIAVLFAVFLVYQPVSRCATCKKVGLLPDVEEETTTTLA